MKESLKSLKIEITSTDNDIKKQADDNFKKLKLEMVSTVNEMKKDNNDKLNSLKNENSRSKNEVDNLILLVNEIKKGTDDNFKNLKLEMASSVNELKKEMVSSFKKSNPFSFGAPHGIQNNIHVSKLTESGYSYVYNKPYNHATTSSEMDEIKSSCLPTTNLCLGGRDSTNDVLLVVSCGLCSVVFT
jgi:seryl-tRNA synthetase